MFHIRRRRKIIGTVRARLLVLVLALLLPFLLIQFVMYAYWYRVRASTVVDAQLEVAYAVAGTFSAYVEDVIHQEATLGQAILNLDSPEAIRGLLQRSAEEYDTVQSFHWITPEGYILYSSDNRGSNVYIGDREYFQEILRGVDHTVSNLIVGRLSELPSIIIAHAMKDQRGKLTGVVSASVIADNLHALFADIRRAPDANISLFDRVGNRAFSSLEAPHHYERGVDPLVMRALNGEPAAGTFRSAFSGDLRLGARVPVAETGWVAGASSSHHVAMRPVRETLLLGVCALLVTLFLSVLISRKFYREITRSLALLQNQARQISAGNLSATVSLPQLAEFDALAAGFNKAASDIKFAQGETHQTLDRMRESEQRLRAALDNYPSLFVMYDADRRITFINRRGIEIVGISEEQVLGKRDEELFSKDVTDAYLALLNRTVETGQIQSKEARLTTKTGGYVLVITYVPLLDQEKRLRQILGVTYDITQRKRAEEALRKIAEELARSNRELEQFAYVASHDLQEPLRMITGYLQLIERRYGEKLDKDGREFMEFAVDGSVRMKTLISDLLAYSRIGARGRLFAPTNMARVVKTVLRDLAASLEESEAEVEVTDLPTIVADEFQMTQLLQNLIANSIKFRNTDKKLKIEVGAAPQSKDSGKVYWRFWVKDNGIGIEPQYFQKIFLIFQRLHGRDKYPGTGIGLAMAKKIVERHGGRIWVESVYGEGSTFNFTVGSEGDQS